MLAFQSWLGVDDTFLYENLTPYAQIDRSASQRPQIILAIGSSQKRQFFEKHLSVCSDGNQNDAVRFAALSNSIYIVDCEFHPAPHHNDSKSAGARILHKLKRPMASVTEAMYLEIFCPFAHTLLLFSADFGGNSRVAQFIIQWAEISESKNRPRPSIIIVPPMQVHTNQFVSQTIDSLRDQINLNANCQKYREALLDYSQTFETLDISLEPQQVRMLLYSILQKASKNKGEQGLYFNAIHLKALLRTSIQDFAQNKTAEFDFCRAARVSNPVPSTASDHLIDFLQRTADLGTVQLILAASALVMNAYPPGMHDFPPASLFAECYAAQLSIVEDVLERPGISKQIRNNFIELAQEHHETSKPSAQMHALLLQRAQLSGSDLTNTCAFCFIRLPRYALICNHRLCRPCTMILGREYDPWNFCVARCPWCLTLNSVLFIMNPPTAGLRLLQLGGHDQFNTWLFMKSLQRTLGISALHLSDYFDGVVASDSAVFLTITTFVEGWSLADSQHHLRRIKQPRFLRQNRVTFGKGREWNLEDDRFFRNTDIILERKKNRWSNLILSQHVDKSHATYDTYWPLQNIDIIVQYNGGYFECFEKVIGQLYSALFYVELLQIPVYHTTLQQECSIRICCRLPPGPSLVDFLVKLVQQNACLGYRASELQYTETPLCTPETLSRCKDGDVFSRRIDVQVESMDSILDIRLDIPEQGCHSISNCPYALKKLAYDQGLACHFGSADHRTQWPKRNDVRIETSIERLSAILSSLRSGTQSKPFK